MTGKPVDMRLEDSNIHCGHRGRMRAKLSSHGQRIFDTYELLEMLLYHTVPYKDTNPIAKRLLLTFGDLDGVLSASREDLLSVNGIGERTADLLRCVGELSSIIGSEPEIKDDRFTDHCRVGRFLVSCFENETEKKILALYFNNSMSLLAIEEVYTDIDYESGRVTVKPFLDSAIKLGAVAVITAHNHPYGSPYPTVGDRATNQTLRMELEKAKITLAEHYVISGNRYTAIVDGFVSNLCQSLMLEDFINSRQNGSFTAMVPEDGLCDSYYNKEDLPYLSRLLSFVLRRDCDTASLRLMKSFFTVEGILTADLSRTQTVVGENAALYLKLLAYLTSRRKTDLFGFNRVHSMVEVAEYFKALYIGNSVENVHIMCFDAKGRAILCERVSEGIVNSAEVLPRKMLEIAIKCSASSVVLAHNHPFGVPVPSREDLSLTSEINGLFRSVGIGLTYHFIVAGQRCEVIKYGEATDGF